MIAPEPTAKTLDRLKKAGFGKREAKGSHALYTCPHGRVTVTVVTGHRTTSPGVLRRITKAIKDCESNCP
ncbi:type II toxin-antitoxin system HicA family toxin [Gordonia sp. FQ]|uniref:type II toxin-antitoxin system HicA family toxin n=1 Tax=Gordonia sp. FQ TaxID=3446634 RepID=UPI003F85D80E